MSTTPLEPVRASPILGKGDEAGKQCHEGQLNCLSATAPASRSFADALRQAKSTLYALWLVTNDDIGTFVGPNTIFGLCGALSGSLLATASQDSLLAIFQRVPLVILFSWSNLLVFNLANQRLPEAVREDALNKPWRPVPRGLLTPDQARRAMLVLIPAVLALNHFALGVGAETALLLVATWAYNDLRGCDEDWMLRSGMLAFAFALYNSGALKVAGGSARDLSVLAIRDAWQGRLLSSHGPRVSAVGAAWVCLMSFVVLTTTHVQDLKDRDGDLVRGRRTAPIVLGDRVARWTVAVPVALWSCVCLGFWPAVGFRNLLGIGQAVLGLVVAYRCLAYSEKSADRRTFELWALWTLLLYAMPLASA